MVPCSTLYYQSITLPLRYTNQLQVTRQKIGFILPFHLKNFITINTKLMHEKPPLHKKMVPSSLRLVNSNIKSKVDELDFFY